MVAQHATPCKITLIGQGIGPSLSPAMHEHEGHEQGLNYTYDRFELLGSNRQPSEVGQILRELREQGYTGANVTHPCKQEVLTHLTSLSPEAKALGAVNTVLITDTEFIGHNTDLTGFMHGLQSGLPSIELARVTQIGAGGAGSATAYALLQAGTAELRLADADLGRAQNLAATLAQQFPMATVSAHPLSELETCIRWAEGIVHATPIGMREHPGTAFPTTMLSPNQWVADIVYRPLRTQLIEEAEALGCRTIDGGLMAVGQAADAFALFSGVTPNRDRMRQHFIDLISVTE